MFWNKKKSRFEVLRDTVSERAHDALESAQDVFHQAQDVLQESLGQAPDKLSDLRENTGGAVGRAQGAVGTLGSTLGTRVGSLKQDAQKKLEKAEDVAHDRFDETRQKLLKKRNKIDKKIARGQKTVQERVQERKEDTARDYVPEVEVNDGGQKYLWLAVGVVIGAAVGVLLAPSSGRRNRALLRDKAVKGAHKVSDLGGAVKGKTNDLSNRASGVVHEVAGRVGDKVNGQSDDADDTTIADRVRSELGRVQEAVGVERINVDSCDGVVTLRGPVVNAVAQAALVAAAHKAAGVREVKSELLVENDGEEAFVG